LPGAALPAEIARILPLGLTLLHLDEAREEV